MQQADLRARVRRGRRWTSRLTGSAVAAVGVVGALVVAAAPSGAATGTTLFNQTFANNTASGVVLPAAPNGGTNVACLTAQGNSTTGPLLSCNGSSDANGSGALQLTSASGDQDGGVFGTTGIPASQGLDIQFSIAQFGGNGADGISFDLAAVNPSNPTPPASIGQIGGGLGYSQSTGGGGQGPGLSYGYLGVGFDVYGNFSESTTSGTGCGTLPAWANSREPNQVVVRGPGETQAGYCPVASTAQGSGAGTIDGGPTGTRASSTIPVEVVVNTTTSPVTPATNATPVPAGDGEVIYTPIGGSQQVVGPFTLPSVPDGMYPSGYLNGSGYPNQLAFGWAASTGGSTDFHQVTGAIIAKSINPVPVLTTSQTATMTTAGGVAPQNSTVTYSVASGVSSTSTVSEAQAPTLTQTFPTGVAPVNGSGTSWSCGAPSGQTITCTYTGAIPLAVGNSLPGLTFTGTVTGSNVTPSAVQNNSSGTVSSLDALPATASPTVTANPAPTPPTGHGYWLVGKDGGVFAFGTAQFYGSLPYSHITPVAPISAITQTSDNAGYWEVGQDGGVFGFGDAKFYGSLPVNHISPAAPVSGIASPDGGGYWLVGQDGGVYAFGDAPFLGSLPASRVVPAHPIVGIESTPTGKGYWLIGADGGVYAFGDAKYYGSVPGLHVTPAPTNVVAMTSTPSGAGYWITGGGFANFGDAGSFGNPSRVLAAPEVGIASPDAGGYWIDAADGGVFAYGDAAFFGSLPAIKLVPAAPIDGIAGF